MFLNILGYKVSTRDVNTIVLDSLSGNSLRVVNTINPHSYVEAKRDVDFKQALLASDELIPDGSGIVLAANKLYGKHIRKIAGADLYLETMRVLNNSSGKVFFLGSTDEVLRDIIKKANVEFPNVSVSVYSPPYKTEFSSADIQLFIKLINDVSPDVIWVGLTAPKQEKLIHEIHAKINGKMISGIGAVFDFYAGNVKRPKKIWIDLHLEWLVRLIGEPKRLWRRTLISAPIFLLDMYRYKLGAKKC
ncbi:WecB/TagA/CpsF family glycosyltransferase [Vibrio vulnificus]|uniref:WecB/TagA/CpsF family glycosyltransferase n=1 Tax=Vibrio vulnificus TaxID=672 RepID=UPI0009277B4A|nr:WecB/TagA/CpsF family glycosyltransferase [Vibrio vulnificus]OJI42866.1 putative N-acetylmannosaminyltransferase [Vibrio vulnificus]